MPRADYVVLAVPLTPDTRHLLYRRRIDLMKPGACVINIARAEVLDNEALAARLTRGELAGAVLDVVQPEPLPADSPLWTTRNLIITPHVSGDADLTRDRARILFDENVRRFAACEPLLNTVDVQAGY